jgi:glyoxylase-like metal-dependent hydrolase (beta-lactamase superfamily II)
MPVRVQCIESPPFAENSYLVWQEGAGQAVVIDPGFEPDAILDALYGRKQKLAAILCTHGHVDHIAGNRALKEAYPDAPILIGHADARMLTSAQLNLSASWGFDVTSPAADQLVADGDRLTLAGLDLTVREIPGHTPGHVVYVFENEGRTIVLGGDVLFQGSVGRTDFPDGSFQQLAQGIRSRLWPLPDDSIVYPGHGPPTTTGAEKRTNPFVGERA